MDLILPLSKARRTDTPVVGGKGANLGEMLGAGLPVPPGFVLPIAAYEAFYEANALGPRVAAELAKLDIDDPAKLDRVAASLQKLIVDGQIPEDLRAAIGRAYESLGQNARVAVRSSATAEDTPQFSFAGMFESILNVEGMDELPEAVKRCWASTFGARVLFYRINQGMPAEMPVAVVVQRMVASEKSGVMFTSDPATRDSTRIVIEAAWGLGEMIVQGAVTPDRHVLDKTTLEVIATDIAAKEVMLRWNEEQRRNERVDIAGQPCSTQPVLTKDELSKLGDLARRAEEHYGKPQDLEFAIERGDIFLTQSRPITTLGQGDHPVAQTSLVHGLGASPGIASGRVRVLSSPAEAASLQPGEILVTRLTSPDWVPAMRRAAAIVTDSGGMTSHAAIVARELAVPCIVGSHNATTALATGTLVTVDGSKGTVTAGAAPSAPAKAEQKPGMVVASPAIVTATKLYVNLAEPERAAEIAARDVDGVGLLRAEFMMLEALEHTHPREFLKQKSEGEFVARMAEGTRAFASAFAPRPVIYRAMDFRSNEFRGLTGAAEHEPTEENPMIGYRGCFRYTREPDLFAIELRAIAEVRREHGNLHLMIPFVRTPSELEACLALVQASPLGADRALERWIMAEVPSVIHHLPAYARLGITGVSIGSNDLTQLMLGVDRDSDLFGPGYDERDGAVLDAIRRIIETARSLGLTCSICGQAPSVHSEYAAQLVEWGIDSISVNVDAIDRTRHNIAVAERRLLLDEARRAISH